MGYFLFALLVILTISSQQAWGLSERDHPGAAAGKIFAVALIGFVLFVAYTHFHYEQVHSFFFELWGKD